MGAPDSAIFATLNRGKRSVVLDLKTSAGVDHVRALIADADVLVEQFRPGVMARFGLGYDTPGHLNKRLIYGSITGYGRSAVLWLRLLARLESLKSRRT